MPLRERLAEVARRQREYDDPFSEMDDSGLHPAPYPDTDDDPFDETYWRYTKELMEERLEGVRDNRQVWVRNLLFLAGQQDWEYDGGTGVYRPPQRRESWRQEWIDNQLVSFNRYYQAKMTKARPVMTCVARSTDAADIAAASLGDALLRSKWNELDMAETLNEMVAWLPVCGNAWMLPDFDEYAGKMEPMRTEAFIETGELDEEGMPLSKRVQVPADENGEPIEGEDGMPDMEAEPAYRDIGELAWRCLSPFQVFPDASATSFQDITSFVIAESVPLRDMKWRWPDADTDGMQEEDTTEIDQYDNLFHSARTNDDASSFITTDTYGGGALSPEIKKVLVMHYYEKPSQDWPHGRHWVCASKRLLEEPGELPNRLWPPVFHMRDVVVPGQLLGASTMTPAVEIQKRYNRINAQIMENHELLLQGKWTVPRTARIGRHKITHEPGEVIQYTPPYKPELVVIPALPPAVYAEREKAAAEIERVLGFNRASMGESPTADASGRLALTLQEADDADLGPVVSRLERVVAKSGWSLIQLAQRNYTESRMIQISGPNKSWVTKHFIGTDLSGLVNVEVQAGSAFPWSKTAQQAQMIEVLQVLPHIYMDPETQMFDYERFARSFPIGGEMAVTNVNQADMDLAMREEAYFKEWDGMGPVPAPQLWDRNEVHLRSHSRLLKSASFMKWSPPRQRAFIDHWHATWVAVNAQLGVEQMVALQNDEKATQSSDESSASGSNPKSEKGMPPDQGASKHKSETSTAPRNT